MKRIIAAVCLIVVLCAVLVGITLASAPEDAVCLDFGAINTENSPLLFAAAYDADGKMLAVKLAREENGCAVAYLSADDHARMAEAKLFVLDGLTLCPLMDSLSPRADSTLSWSFYDSTRKVAADEPLKSADSYTIRLARNEAEGCQLVFALSGEGNYQLAFTPFTSTHGEALRTEVCEEHYIVCESSENSGLYPDALVPVSAPHTFSSGGQQNHPFYIKVWADKDTAAGDYTASVTVTAPDGSVTTIPLSASVWDFELPDTPACTTAFGLNRWYIAEAHGVEEYSEADQALYNAYYEFLLDHNISAYDLPYDLMDERAEAYMSDPRVTSFCLPYFEPWQYDDADELLQAYYEKVSSNPEWADKAYFYVVDEPYTAEHYEMYLEVVARLKELCPGYHMVMPTHISEFEEAGEVYNAILMHAEGTDIFCPLSSLMEDTLLREDIETYLPDNELWWYVCCGPSGEYCNVLTNMEGIRARLLLWQQMDFGISGLLYWSTTFWAEGNPWENGWTYRGSEEPDWSFEEFGDGSLLYPGSQVGIDGPIASLRLEILSDGIDDFDYLTLAGEHLGPAYVEEMIAKVTTSLTEYTHDDELLMLVRNQIGEDLSAALAEGN